MGKTPLISAISQEKKEKNRGSIEFQVFSFTNKIQRISSHLEFHRRDYLSQRGLQKLLAKRERLLSYLSKKNGNSYKELIGRLNIRESTTSIREPTTS
uniref:30S ribosomal protein S15 n=1 Tax=Monsonia speciosa TaxID=163694 RepID=B7T3U9_9ROSI|nr:ribosomal protein S15 [Monsonia speciosa]YP_003934360.1 ribosomal protein S15 [Monsonia speciosa]ACH47310.1 ribosomal protein S15 [Monsonia speciosa]ADJ66485.1 ribosomal protein S15 [Monsonia speciosa]ADJ66495.1 ribosomal protein S15 [Monsonia speciosa]